mgnify:CR=1 FL=1
MLHANKAWLRLLVYVMVFCVISIVVFEWCLELEERQFNQAMKFTDQPQVVPVNLIKNHGLWNSEPHVQLNTNQSNGETTNTVQSTSPIVEYYNERVKNEMDPQVSERVDPQTRECIENSIFVTGLPRSGTTIIGYMASVLDNQKMVHEPANPSNRLHPIIPKFIPTQNGFPFEEQFENMAQEAETKQNQAKAYFANLFTAACSENRVNQIILKDPTFVTSAEWSIDTFGMAGGVLVIRHPAGLIASWYALKWEDGDLRRLINMYNDHMENYVLPIAKHANQSSHWFVLKHEDYCRDPLGSIIQLQEYMEADEELTPVELNKIENAVQQHTAARGNNHHKFHKVIMDPDKALNGWKRELTPTQIQDIKEGTREIWKLFYSENDW